MVHQNLWMRWTILMNPCHPLGRSSVMHPWDLGREPEGSYSGDTLRAVGEVDEFGRLC